MLMALALLTGFFGQISLLPSNMALPSRLSINFAHLDEAGLREG